MNSKITYGVKAHMLVNLGDYERLNLEIEINGIMLGTKEVDIENARMEALALAVKVQNDIIERANYAREEAKEHGEPRARYERRNRDIGSGRIS